MGLPGQHHRARPRTPRPVTDVRPRVREWGSRGDRDGSPPRRPAGRTCSGVVDEVLHRVVPLLRHGELPSLTDDGRTRQQRVAAAVIGVQVAVDHQLDLVQLDTDRGERLRWCSAAGPVPVLRLGVAKTQTGVEQDQPPGRVGPGSRTPPPRVRPPCRSPLPDARTCRAEVAGCRRSASQHRTGPGQGRERATGVGSPWL